MITHTLDAKNLLCPMPVIRLQNFIASLKQNSEVNIECTDPGVLNDIPAWCRINGHEIVAIEEKERSIVIKVKALIEPSSR